MVTIVDRLARPTSTGFFGEGAGVAHYIAQTFVAGGSALNSVEFLLDTEAGFGATEFRVLIATVDVTGGFDPGVVLFESGDLVDPAEVGGTFIHFTVNTSKLALTPGATYAFILDAVSLFDTVESHADVGVSHSAGTGVDYVDGFAASLASSGDRATDFNSNWFELSSVDLSFRLVFSNPGVTISGTKGKNIVDATHTPKGQPLPTAGDDSISGLGNRDKLSGLGGDDTLNGGKDKDRLFGGDGEDLFLFSVGLKKNAPDKIMDFVPIDDTILLAMSKFKGLPQGAVSDAAFRDIGEAASDADRIIYKASGKLLADHDGKGGDDPRAFAKLIGAPDITAADFLVV